MTVKKIQIDRKRIPRSYRNYLKKMVEMGEFFEIDDEIDWNLEMGAICRRALETGAPSPIFNKVKGCPDGFRAAEVGYQKSGTPGRDWARVAVQLGLPPETGLMEIMHAYNEVMENGTVHPPKIVENNDAPCKENIWLGDDIDITGVTFRNDPILPVGLPGVGPDSTQVAISLFSSADVLAYLKREGFPVIEALITFESGMCWFVIKTKNDWHEITGWRLKKYMEKLGNALWGTHYGHTATKVLVVGEDIDPTDPVAVSWAFATRNHPTQGCFYFPELQSVGIGPESYHSMVDFNAFLMDHDDIVKGNSLVIYSCIGLEEHVGQPKPVQLTFERNFPDAIKEKVRANWKKWGLPELNDPNRNPTWKYFATTGAGEAGRRG